MDIPKGIEAFRAAALGYCEWAEATPGEQEDAAVIAIRLLASLYHHAQALPGADPEPLPEHDILQKGERTVGIYERFKNLPFQYYSEVFDPIEVPGAEPVVGDLADDLMDIYADLKQGLLYCEQGHVQQGVFHWTFTFGVHWGRHATSALRALHCYLADPKREG